MFWARSLLAVPRQTESDLVSYRRYADDPTRIVILRAAFARRTSLRFWFRKPRTRRPGRHFVREPCELRLRAVLLNQHHGTASRRLCAMTPALRLLGADSGPENRDASTRCVVGSR